MVSAKPIGGDGSSAGGKSSSGVLHSVTTLWLLLAKQAILASRKLKNNSNISPASLIVQRPKKFISVISNKAIKFSHRKKTSTGDVNDDGDEGLWRREILMGDKCQPLDFSGVIYYDRDGNRLSHLPMRSPRASPLPNYAVSPVKSGRSSPFNRR